MAEFDVIVVVGFFWKSCVIVIGLWCLWYVVSVVVTLLEESLFCDDVW